MFKLTDRFWWPVVLEVPGDGQTVKHAIELQFLRKSEAELEQLREAEKTDAGICRAVVRGWKRVLGDDNQELTYTEENLNQLLDEIAGSALTIAVTYFDAMLGAARRKNFAGLRGTGL